MKLQGQYQINDLPILPRLAYLGLLTSLGLAAFAKLAISLLQIAFPLFDPASQTWFSVLLAIVWTPSLVGLFCGYVTIVRYPDLSKFIRVRDPIITTTDSCVWPILGLTLMLVGFLGTFGAFEADTIPIKILVIHTGTTFFFIGYLLSIYERKKNVVIATFLDVTLGVGAVLLPIFLPAIILGWRNYKTKLEKTPRPE